jgi:magnesium transporter
VYDGSDRFRTPPSWNGPFGWFVPRPGGPGTRFRRACLPLVIVDCALYTDGRRTPGTLDFETAVTAARRADDAFVWVGLYEPAMAELAELAREFSLHPLAVEDAVHAHQRPKLDVYGDTLFVVLKTATYVDSEEVVSLGEVMLFVGPDFVVSVRHGDHNALDGLRATLEADPERLRCGTAGVLHAVVDHVVDGYEPVLVGLDADIDEIEEQVFSGDGRDHAMRVFKLKREVLDFRRGVRPLIPAVRELAAGGVPGIDVELSESFRDVLDHLLRVTDHLDGLDALLDGALSANLAQVGVRQNEDMRKISAWVAIAAVPTMIAGIYGMNFEHMPELSTRYGYFVVLALMAVACLLLYGSFKRREWL